MAFECYKIIEVDECFQEEWMWQGVSTAIYLKLFGFHDKVNLFDCLFLEHCIPHHWTPSVSQVFKEVTDYVSLNVDISDCNIICELNHQKCIELKFKFKNLLAINNFWRTVHSCLWIFNTETSYCKKKKKNRIHILLWAMKFW